MKRGTPNHPKVADLAARLNIDHFAAVGILELLWHFTAKFAPQGDIGKYSDTAIAKAIGWKRPTGTRGVTPQCKLSDALVGAKWLDRCLKHRLVVHDWKDHADQSVIKYLSRHGLDFVQAVDILPLPEPEPEPKPYIAAAAEVAVVLAEAAAENSPPPPPDQISEPAHTPAVVDVPAPQVSLKSAEVIAACKPVSDRLKLSLTSGMVDLILQNLRGAPVPWLVDRIKVRGPYAKSLGILAQLATDAYGQWLADSANGCKKPASRTVDHLGDGDFVPLWSTAKGATA